MLIEEMLGVPVTLFPCPPAIDYLNDSAFPRTGVSAILSLCFVGIFIFA
jgi:hypothetical protein